MAKCNSCAANYDDNYRYCPYCSTARSAPSILVVQGQADPRLYEDGVLRLKCIIKEEVVGSYKGWFGKTGEWQESLRIGQLELIAISHEKGEYVAITSAAFRHLLPREPRYGLSGYFGYELEDLEEPLKNAFDHVYIGKPSTRSNNDADTMRRALFETLFREQKIAWENFNASLENEGWFGITDEAIGRKLPRSGNGGWRSILAQYPSGWADIKPKDPYSEPYYDESDRLRTYRYHRQT